MVPRGCVKTMPASQMSSLDASTVCRIGMSPMKGALNEHFGAYFIVDSIQTRCWPMLRTLPCVAIGVAEGETEGSILQAASSSGSNSGAMRPRSDRKVSIEAEVAESDKTTPHVIEQETLASSLSDHLPPQQMGARRTFAKSTSLPHMCSYNQFSKSFNVSLYIFFHVSPQPHWFLFQRRDFPLAQARAPLRDKVRQLKQTVSAKHLASS